MLNSFWDWVTGTNRQGPQATPSIYPYDYTELYQKLYDLYNNDDAIADSDTTRRLRTVVNRSVEFYASKMLPGKKIGVTSQNAAVKTAIERVIKSSNLGNQKPAMLRGFSLYGDSFIRVRGDNENSYLEDISPFYVTDFGEDSRGILTYTRIDIPILDAQQHPALYTEYWDAETQTERVWEATVYTSTTQISSMGEPSQINTFAELGITFIPIVHTKFRDSGDLRGLSCVYHALDKIYEANRLATRLHDLLFRFGKPLFVAGANDKDQAGRPLPPPKINTTATGNATSAESAKEETIFGDVVGMPGMSTLEALIPDVRYADALAILNAHMEEIEKDLPELRWYSMSPTERSAMSGTALRTLLGAAVDRANEARNNFLASLSRAMEMALVIGNHNGLFPGVSGTFGTDAFEHELVVDDSWGESIDEKAATMQALTAAGMPAKAAMKLAGFSEEQVKEAFPDVAQPTPGAAPAPTGSPRLRFPGQSGSQVVRVG